MVKVKKVATAQMPAAVKETAVAIGKIQGGKKTTVVQEPEPKPEEPKE